MTRERQHVDVFDRPVAWRYHAVERLGLRGEDRIAGLAIGAGYPRALEPIRAAVAGLDGPVCDVGAALGAATAWIGAGSAARMTAVEPELRALGLGRQAFPQLSFVGAVASALPFAGGTCAAVTLLGVVSLVGDADPVLAEAARVVRPGGAVMLSDLFATGSATVEVATTQNKLRSLDQFEAMLDRHGLRTERVETIPHVADRHWADVAAAVDEEITRRHAGTPGFQRWRDDGEVLGQMLDDSTVEVVTITTTRRER